MTQLYLTWQFVDYWAEKTPDAEAIVFGDRRVTFARFQAEVDCAARALLEAGVRRGDRVALVSMARPEFFYTFMAANRIGAIWLGLSPKFTLDELRYVIGDCQPTVLIALNEYRDRDLASDIATLDAEFPCIRKSLIIGEPVPGFDHYCEYVGQPRAHLDGALAERAEKATQDDRALLLYTSGSTGKPKGVVHTHRSIIANVAVQSERFAMQKALRCLLHFPINHVAADVEIGFTSIYVGGACVMMDHFDPAETLRIVEQERITMLGQVPAMFLMEFGLPSFPTTDFSSVESLVWGGSSAPKLVIDVLAGIARRTGATLRTGYGSTELGGFVTYSSPEDTVEILTNTAGRIAPEFELRIVDDQRRSLPAGETGEIAVRGPILMKEYWNKPEQTRAVLDEDGWYYSSDLGYIDAAGNLRISGRKSEMYKTGGENVFPREVEDVLERHPAVLMAAVVGVPHELYMEVGHAFVIPHPGKSIAAEELHHHCKEHLANFKIPKQFEVRPVLPMLPNGKVNKMLLKAELAAGD